ncbi:MAG: hypothetical protein A6F70_06095 [Cycloclasticus sp. symbiont of Bathymodiolus heckerae]|nr:MAG: hypothetical protein A6F70_06095 [Cycloclasticus sp. symbiont of Bathymodiolus heckerae]
MDFKVDKQDITEVRVIDVKMPFISMVVFLVKLSIAAIPAFIILSIVGSILFGIFGTAVHTGMRL